MERDIFLAGQGLTRFGEWWGKSLRDLMDEATEAALQSSGMSALDIDLVIVANMLAETTNDQAHLGAVASSLLPHHPPALRVESACGSGALALHTACAFLESKRAETILVIGVEKMTDASNDAISQALMGAADSELDAPSGLTFPGIFGLITNRYMHEYGLTRDELSLVSAVHHRHGKENPFAQFRQEISPDAVSESPLVADPLRLLDCSPVSDGAAACILSTIRRSPFRIAASAVAADSVSITERASLTSFPATQEAMRHALEEANIERSDVHAIETHDCFSIAALINMEDLGFAEPGEGIKIYKSLWGRNVPAPQYPFFINKSGGLKACGHPVAATGMKQLIDLRKQLASSRETFGLAHNFGGACGSCGIHILENLEA
ncbi:MAG: beta-ketoacyl synthase N-terminal-like domain-containing protein [Patescibacteria group bacterium]